MKYEKVTILKEKKLNNRHGVLCIRVISKHIPGPLFCNLLHLTFIPFFLFPRIDDYLFFLLFILSSFLSYFSPFFPQPPPEISIKCAKRLSNS